MLFVPKDLPKVYPSDFSKSYDPMQCNPQWAERLNQISALRNNFYSFFSAVAQKSDNELVENVDWLPWMDYLNGVVDLLEFGVKSANFPYDMSWESGASPGSPFRINNDNERAATTELIFSRLMSSVGMLSTCRGYIMALRAASAQNNEFQVKELVKPLFDRLLFSSVRLYKLNYSGGLIYPG